ncbi:hypothetical protein EIP91_000329 [Steccherinum ochraceum]|uniref:Uncharacterized protein n=1 Tax=Steccherinum ochraceum TaxID=92696 RepID=A0A4R0RJF5_9APHY|nr:hypothetical protein EIP91_000329 [Steccherinum ochraceum]
MRVRATLRRTADSVSKKTSSRKDDEDSDDGSVRVPEEEEEEETEMSEHRNALNELLSKNWNFGGSLAFQESFMNAPNPNLAVNDFGTIGIPLGSRDAEAIKGVATRKLPGARGSETDGQGAWEVESSKISIENAAFSGLLEKAAEQAYRLVLLTKGSCLQPSVESSDRPGVTHEMGPITDGYRLMLIYHLVDTISEIPPAISHDALFLERVQPILTSWKDDPTSPEKIVYLLNNAYSEDPVKNANDLGPADSHLVELLATASSTVGFCIGLGTVQCQLEGDAFNCWELVFGELPVNGQDWREIRERDSSVRSVVTLEGRPICKSLDFIPGAETIPEDLSQNVELDDWYDDSWHYECEPGDVYVQGVKNYRRAAVVIWRPGTEIATKHPLHPLTLPCLSLSRITSCVLREAYEDRIATVLSRCSEDPVFVSATLCHAAIAWKDASLWERTTAECSKFSSLAAFENYDQIWEAITALGFNALQERLSMTIKNDSQDLRRLKFLDELLRWASGKDGSSEVDSAVRAWSATQFQHILGTLHGLSSELGDVVALLQLTAKLGGIEALKNTIIPKVCRSSDAAYLIKLSKKLEYHPSLASSEVRDELLYSLAAATIPKLPSPSGDFYKESLAEDTKHLLQHLQRSDKLRGSALRRLTEISGLKESQKRQHVDRVVVPVLSHVAKTFTDECLMSSDVIPTIQSLLDTALRYPPTYRDPSYGELLAVIAGKDCLWDSFYSCVSKNKVHLQKNAATVGYCISSFCTRFESQQTPPSSKPALTAAVLELLSPYVASLTSGRASGSESQDMLFAIESWLRVQAQAITFPPLFDQLLRDGKGTAYLLKVLLPLLPALATLTTRFDAFGILAPAFQSILLAWVGFKNASTTSNTGAASKPLNLSAWTCSCVQCKQVVAYLRKPSTRKTTFRQLSPDKILHIKQLCDRHVPPSAAKVTLKGQTIEILMLGDQLNAAPPPGKDSIPAVEQALKLFLKHDDDVLQRLLGLQYDRIMMAIKGPAHTPSSAMVSTPSVPTSSVATSASTSTHLPARVRSHPEPGEIQDDDHSDDRPTKRQKVEG